MKVAVLGSGVIGVTSAYYLHRAGHEVVVIDRQPGPALETSFANAGEVSPGYASPWAAPGIPLKAMRWLLMRHAPLVLRPRFDPAMARWLFAMLRNCNARSYAVNKARMVRLAEFSRDQLADLRTALALSYDHRTQGTLQLFRSQHQVEASSKDVEVLKRYGIPYQCLDSDGCVDFEPGLSASRDRFVGGHLVNRDRWEASLADGESSGLLYRGLRQRVDHARFTLTQWNLVGFALMRVIARPPIRTPIVLRAAIVRVERAHTPMAL